MKHRILNLLLIAMISWLWTFPAIQPVAAKNFSGTPYDTFTAGLDNQLVLSAPAYEATFILNIGLLNPQDIFIDQNDIVYIADTGNHRIAIYDPETNSSQSLGETFLVDPRGVFVTEEFIYVADYELKEVIKINPAGEIVQTYGQPTSLLYGASYDFHPTKVAVDARKNLYITVEGNTNGIVQLNDLGEFVRYFGVNTVAITPELLLRRWLMSEEQREILAPLNPRATTNLAIDNRNIIYSIIYHEYGVSMKKINVVGNNILNGNSFYQSDYTDIWVDQKGYIYTISEFLWGAITVYDRSGNLLFRFGINQIGNTQFGQFELASGIAVDSKNNIWALDKIGNNAQVFVRNEFANLVIGAIDAYENGDYALSQDLYQKVLKQNNYFTLAYVGLGLIYQRNNEYDKALEAYRISNYLQGYSEVYWEYRDEWISENIGTILLLIIGFFLLRFIYRKKFSSHPQIMKLKSQIKRWGQLPMVVEFKYLFKVLKHPADVFYDIKYRLAIRWRTAFILFVLFIGINIISDNLIRANLFRPIYQEVELSYEILKYGLLFILLVVSNYLMSSLQNGEGFFRDIFIGAVVALAPMILFKIPLDLLSNVLTYNEAFVYNFGNLIILGWSVFLLLTMIKEIHNYKISELITNLLLTVFTLLILVIIYLVVYVMFGQVFQFVIALYEEWILR